MPVQKGRVTDMLNELYEYEQYTEDISNPERAEEYRKKYGTRLYSGRILSFKGLSRPLLVIARKKLSDYENEKKLNRDKYIKQTISDLNAWLGMPDKEPDPEKEDSCKNELQGWLNYYVKNVLCHEETDTNTATKFSKSLSKKKYDENYFTEKIEPKNDRNRISTFLSVADALVCNDNCKIGRYYLVAKNCTTEDEIFEKIKRNTEGKQEYINKMREGKEEGVISNKVKAKNNILTFTACVIMSNKIQNSSAIVYDDYKNWIKDTSNNREALSHRFYYVDNKETNHCLFKQDLKAKKKKQCIYTINEQWFNECGWEIVDIDDLKKKQKEKENVVFYRDYYESDGGPYLVKNDYYIEDR